MKTNTMKNIAKNIQLLAQVIVQQLTFMQLKDHIRPIYLHHR